jgi:hypothetical protein
MRLRLFVAVSAALFFSSVAPVRPSPSVPPDAEAIAQEAYVYAYPMLESYQTMYKQVADPSSKEYVGGFGVFRNYSEAFTPANHDIVTPNNDTPYSWAWLDLRAEPTVLSVPAVSKDRYYVMQWIDLYTFNFAYVGVRATGFDAGKYLFAGPGWNGPTPPGIKKVFHSETSIILTLTRTRLDGPSDVSNVQAIQAKYTLQPLSAYLHQPAPPPAPRVDFPPYVAEKAQDHDFIGYLNFLLQFCVPPNPSEVGLWKRFATIGIGPGRAWNSANVDPALLAAIDAGVSNGKKQIDDALTHSFSSNGLFGSREFMKNDYTKRAVGAAKGLYGNSEEEAWYGGFVGDGNKLVVLHFPKGQLPPAKFFWSFTLYTLPDRWLYANAQNRYSIGDRTKGLAHNPDGSLDIYIGNKSPGKTKEANWLPAPTAKYSLVARVYGPEPSVLSGAWTIPSPMPTSPGQ